jgi:excisionase family DNA binding protein
MTTPSGTPQLLAPREVAALFRVDPKTVTRWAEQGRLTTVRTLGGHRRFRADEVYALLHGSTTSFSGLAQDPGEGHSA